MTRRRDVYKRQAPKRTLREFRFDDIAAVNVGDILKADVFAEGDKVDVVRCV